MKNGYDTHKDLIKFKMSKGYIIGDVKDKVVEMVMSKDSHLKEFGKEDIVKVEHEEASYGGRFAHFTLLRNGEKTELFTYDKRWSIFQYGSGMSMSPVVLWIQISDKIQVRINKIKKIYHVSVSVRREEKCL